MTRHDVTALACAAGGSVAGALLNLRQFPQVTAIEAVLALLIVFLTTGGTAEALVRGNEQRDAIEMARRRRLASPLIEAACRGTVRLMSKLPERTAAVVFLPDATGLLRTAFTWNKAGKPDGNLQFATRVGCTGHAWATGEQAIAHLGEASKSDLELVWKLSPEYVRLTEHLRVVVSTPIRDPDDPNQVIGIVSVDSDADESECGLASPESLGEALQLSAMLAQILKLAD